jgi:flagellar hook assembly protein FlgD
MPTEARISMSAPTPNPSRSPTAVTIILDEPGRLRVAVFDPTGRQVREVGTGVRGAGSHTFEWDGNDAAGRPVSSGVYFVQASLEEIGREALSATAVRRMLVLR